MSLTLATLRKLLELMLLLGFIVLTLSVSYAYAGPSDIRNKIITRLDAMKDLGAHEFDVDVRGDRVLLEGYVSSRADKERVVQVARETKGVDTIEVRLEIRPPQSNQIAMALPPQAPAPTDNEVTDRVIAALKSENVSGLAAVSISTLDGVVRFAGELQNHREIDRMLSIALMIDGVRSVRSDVKLVKPITR